MNISIKSISIDGKKLSSKIINQLSPLPFLTVNIVSVVVYGFYIVKNQKVYVASHNGCLFSIDFLPEWTQWNNKPEVSFKRKFRTFKSSEDASLFETKYTALKNSVIGTSSDTQLFY